MCCTNGRCQHTCGARIAAVAVRGGAAAATSGAAVVRPSVAAACNGAVLWGCRLPSQRRAGGGCGSGLKGGRGRKAASLLIPRHPSRAMGCARTRPLHCEQRQQLQQSRRWRSAKLPAQPAQLAAGRAGGRLRAAQGPTDRRVRSGVSGSQKGPGAVKKEGGAGEAPMLLPKDFLTLVRRCSRTKQS